MQYALAASTLLFATTTLAAIHEVTVGPGLTYNPNSISDVEEGDWISVTFGAGHDIVQSTFAAPCQAMDGGIYSGPSPSQGDVFSWQVNSTDPSWFYCSVGRHCQGGMALAINPTSQNTIEAYQSAAEDTTSSSPSGSDAVGGTFAAVSDDDSSSGSSDSSSTASAASGSASASDASASATAATASGSEAASQTSAGATSSATGDSAAAGLKPVGAVVGAVAMMAAWAL